MKVRYKVTTNKPYHIENISYNIPNTDIEKIIMKDRKGGKDKYERQFNLFVSD